MINPKTLNLILKRSRPGYKETRKYYLLFIGPIFVFITILYFNRDIPFHSYVKPFTISIIIVYLGLFFLYIVSNEGSKSGSIKKIILLISEIANDNYTLGKLESPDNIKELHNFVISHPVTTFVFGHVLLKEGHYNEATNLISEARRRNDKLEKIQMEEYLNQKDALYLINLLLSDKRFWVQKILMR